MSTPIRIPCSTIHDIPPVEQLKKQATIAHHVILQFPNTVEIGDEKSGAIERLSQEMPDHSVCDSGGELGSKDPRRNRHQNVSLNRSWLPIFKRREDAKEQYSTISIIRVLSESDVIANAEAILTCAREFRVMATQLMHRVATHLDIPIDTFYRKYSPAVRYPTDSSPPNLSGALDEEWLFEFHGRGCRFRHCLTLQIVEVELGYPNEFGVLNPWFFDIFVKSTAGMETVARLFTDDHHAARAMQVLHRLGYLTEISDNTPEFPDKGLVCLHQD